MCVFITVFIVNYRTPSAATEQNVETADFDFSRSTAAQRRGPGVEFNRLISQLTAKFRQRTRPVALLRVSADTPQQTVYGAVAT